MTEKIEVRYYSIGDGKPDDRIEFYHKYLVYTDHEGKEFYARGGPSIKTPVPLPMVGYGYVKTEYGRYIKDAPDWDEEKDDPREVIAEGVDLSREWRAITGNMDQLNEFKYQYQPLGQNSNATVDDSLARAGLPPAVLDKTLIAPGSHTPFGIFYIDPFRNISAALKDVSATFNNAASPGNSTPTADEAFSRLPDRVEPGMPPEVESLVLFKGDRALFDRQFDEIAGYESLDVVQDYLERHAVEPEAAPDVDAQPMEDTPGIATPRLQTAQPF